MTPYPINRPHYSVVQSHISEPVTYAEAAAHCRVDSDYEKDYITALISVAREFIEDLTGLAATRATYRVVANSWDSMIGTNREYPLYGYGPIDLLIDRSPLVSIESVKTYAPDSQAQETLSSAQYAAITATTPGRVHLIQPLPDVDISRGDAIEIVFVAGYQNAQQSPARLRHAIKMMVGHLYENRASVHIGMGAVQDVPMTIKDLVQSIRVGGAFA